MVLISGKQILLTDLLSDTGAGCVAKRYIRKLKKIHILKKMVKNRQYGSRKAN